MELRKLYKDLWSTIDTLELQLSESQEGNHLAGAALEAGAVAVSDLLDENNSLREQKDTQAKTIKAFRSDIEDLTSVVSERNSQVNNQAKTIVKQIGEMATVDTLQKCNKRQKEIIEKCNQEIEGLTARNKRQVEIISRLEKDLTNYCVKVRTQHQAIIALKSDLDRKVIAFRNHAELLSNQRTELTVLQNIRTEVQQPLHDVITTKSVTIIQHEKEIVMLNNRVDKLRLIISHSVRQMAGQIGMSKL